MNVPMALKATGGGAAPNLEGNFVPSPPRGVATLLGNVPKPQPVGPHATAAVAWVPRVWVTSPRWASEVPPGDSP